MTFKFHVLIIICFIAVTVATCVAYCDHNLFSMVEEEQSNKSHHLLTSSNSFPNEDIEPNYIISSIFHIFYQ